MIAWNRAGLPVARAQFVDANGLLDAITDWYRLTVGENAEAASATLDALLRSAGASADAPTAASLEQALSRLAEQLRKDAPADLDLALAAFRRAVVAL